MFRKSGAIMLAILYTTTVLGFALNLHFCGSKIASVNITAPTKAKAADITCGMKMKCCKNQHVTVKVKDSHQVQQASVLAKVFAIDLSKIPFAEYIFSAQKALIEKLLDRGPPVDDKADEKVPAFIKNRNLRI